MYVCVVSNRNTGRLLLAQGALFFLSGEYLFILPSLHDPQSENPQARRCYLVSVRSFPNSPVDSMEEKNEGGEIVDITNGQLASLENVAVIESTQVDERVCYPHLCHPLSSGFPLCILLYFLRLSFYVA